MRKPIVPWKPNTENQNLRWIQNKFKNEFINLEFAKTIEDNEPRKKQRAGNTEKSVESKDSEIKKPEVPPR